MSGRGGRRGARRANQERGAAAAADNPLAGMVVLRNQGQAGQPLIGYRQRVIDALQLQQQQMAVAQRMIVVGNPNPLVNMTAPATWENGALKHGLDDVFVDVDLSNFPNISAGAPPDVIANYVIEHYNMFTRKLPKKPAEIDTMEHTVVDLFNMPDSSSRMLLDEFMSRFQAFFESESRPPNGVIYDKELTLRLLRQDFPRCRTLLLEHLTEEFYGRYAPAAAVCTFIESDRHHLIKKYFLHVEDAQWDLMTTMMPTPWKRRKTWVDVPPAGPTHDSYCSFKRFLDTAKADFPDVFDGNLISTTANDARTKEKTFTCGVCFDEFPLKSAILCSFPEVIDLLGEEQAGTSNSIDGNDAGPHAFCLDCVRGQALAATTDMPLADGGVGLKCMEPNCKNPILFSKCRSLIPYKVRKLLNERIWEETFGMAKLQNLERCKRCIFAVQYEVPKDELRVFDCRKCGFKYCRVCERNWDDRHFGKRCEEMDEEEKEDLKARKYIEEMNALVIRKCHKCSLPFVKDNGCNRIYCRCGATQCYSCRAPDIDYTHFCSHVRTPGKDCKHCKKKCLQNDNVDMRTDAEVEKIRNDALVKAGIRIDAGKLTSSSWK